MDRIDFEKIFYDALGELQELLRIPSVYNEETVSEQMPYGEGVWRVLDYMRRLALQDGFEVLEYDNHAIAVRISSQNAPLQKKRIDIVSHLDVVKPGCGWEDEPFSGKLKDGWLYGRGTADMKTCAWLTYLSLRMLKEQKLPLTHEVRLVFGCDEERTMSDMRYYISKAGKPSFAFTPDGRFPMNIGEKGALMWRARGEYSGVCKWFKGGTQCNVIPASASACITDMSLKDRLSGCIAAKGYDIDCVCENEELILTAHGRAAHASIPELGHSAVIDLLDVIAGVGGDSMLRNLYDCFAEPYGSGVNLKLSFEQMGDLTLNLGVLNIEDGVVYGEIDARYPLGISSEEATRRAQKACDLKLSLDYDAAPNMCSPDDPYVQALLSAYQEKTGDFSKPHVSGGVSYSKVFGHCVAYGPTKNLEESMAHKANERISVEACIELLEIYYNAMRKIALL